MNGLQFNTLIYTASESLKSPALNFTGSKSKEVNNLIQKVLLRGLKYRTKFKSGPGFGNPLRSVMKNSRKENIPAPKPEVFNIQDIYSAFEKMEADFKEPFVLHFSGMKDEEIAARLNMPEETVKNRIEAARIILMM